MRILDQIVDDVRDLSVNERVQLLERLGELLPVPDGEESDSVREALRRKQELESDPSIGLSWEQIKANLNRGL